MAQIRSASAELIAFFETGDIPTADNFSDFILSTAVYDGTLPLISGSKVSTGSFGMLRTNQITSSHAQITLASNLTPDVNKVTNLGTVSTVGIWVKRNSATDNGKALFGNNANHWQPAMWIGSTTRLYVSLSKWVKPSFFSTGWSNTTDWFYITVTRNGDGASLYKNGAFVDDLTGLGTGETKFDSIGFQSADNSDYFNGNIGPVHMYNRILSTSEVLHNYNALKGRFGLS